MALDRYHPIGTPDELEALELDPREYFSCSENTPRNRGCPYWGRCTMPFKGQPKQAPEDIGVYRESWQSGGVKTMVMPCHRYYGHQSEWKQTGDTIAIIAAPKPWDQALKVPDTIIVHETYEEAREQVQSQISGRSMPKVRHHEVLRTMQPCLRPAEQVERRQTAVNIRKHLLQLESERARRELLTGVKESQAGVTVPETESQNAPSHRQTKRGGGP